MKNPYDILQFTYCTFTVLLDLHSDLSSAEYYRKNIQEHFLHTRSLNGRRPQCVLQVTCVPPIGLNIFHPPVWTFGTKASDHFLFLLLFFNRQYFQHFVAQVAFLDFC